MYFCPVFVAIVLNCSAYSLSDFRHSPWYMLIIAFSFGYIQKQSVELNAPRLRLEVPERPCKKEVDTNSPRRNSVNRHTFVLFCVEIFRISKHKSEAQRFISICYRFLALSVPAVFLLFYVREGRYVVRRCRGRLFLRSQFVTARLRLFFLRGETDATARLGLRHCLQFCQ